jgi:hypothetical protein
MLLIQSEIDRQNKRSSGLGENNKTLGKNSASLFNFARQKEPDPVILGKQFGLFLSLTAGHFIVYLTLAILRIPLSPNFECNITVW